MNTQEESYLSRARIIRKETNPEANTAERVGGLLEEAYAYIFNKLGIVAPGTTQDYPVSIYASNINYAFDLNKPFAVLFPNSSGQVRLWALKSDVNPVAKARNTPSYQANSEWVDMGLTDVNSFTRVKNAVQYDELEQLIRDLNLGTGTGGTGKDPFEELDYVDNTLTYPFPDDITFATHKQIDILTNAGESWKLDITPSTDGKFFTLTNPVPEWVTGVLRVWRKGSSGGENPNPNPGTGTGLVKTIKRSFTTTTYSLPSRAFDILFVERNGQVLNHPETGTGEYSITDNGTSAQALDVSADHTNGDVYQVVYFPGNGTTTPQEPTPAAPGLSINDDTNIATITPVSGFPNPTDYEYELILS